MVHIEYQGGGLFATQEEWRHPRRCIETYEILYGMAGCVCIEEEGERYEIRPGEALMLSPGKRHGGWQTSQGETSFYWVHFSIPDGCDLTDDLRLPTGQLRLPDHYPIAHYFRQLLHVANTPCYPAYAIEGALLTLLGELFYAQTMETKGGNRIVAEAAEWIRIHSERKMTVSEVANRFGYHVDYLSALFRRTYGWSLGRYICEQRLKQAKSLLLTTDDTIKQIAYRLQFSNTNQFNHFFRHHEEMSPTQYRQKFFNTHRNNR